MGVLKTFERRKTERRKDSRELYKNLSQEEYSRSRNERIIRYFNVQKGICAYCFNDMTLELNQKNTAEIEHIVPKSHKHITGHFNEVAACSTCNRYKADKPLYEVIHELRSRYKGFQNDNEPE